MAACAGALIVAVSVCHVPAAAQALNDWEEANEWEEADADAEFEPRRLAVLPIRDFSLFDDELFDAKPGSPPVPGRSDASPHATARGAAIRAIERQVLDLVSANPRFAVVSTDQIRAGLDKKFQVAAGLALVRERFALGRSLYEELRVEAAIEMLTEAAKSAQQLFAEVADPALLADIYLTLGLAERERGRADLAHIAFKRMYSVDPTRTVPAGYYPSAVEKALRGARTDLRATAKADFFSLSPKVDAFLEASGADEALFAYVETIEDQLVLRLAVYSRHTHGFSSRELIPFTLTEADADAVDRALSRWFACTPSTLVQPAGPPRSHQFGKMFIDTAGAYGVYFGFPTREIFHNVGFTFQAAYNIAPKLDLFAKVSLMTAFSDPRQDLTDGSLTSMRTVIGAGVAFETGIWRPFIRPGIELHYVGPFTVVKNPNCKFWGLDDERCPQNDNAYRKVDDALLAGVNLATGFSVAAARGVYLTTQVGFSLYFPLLEETELNYLLSAELGLGYSF